MIDRELRIDGQRPLFIGWRRPYSHIPQPDVRRMIEQYVAMDATKAPEVLILKIGAVAIFIHLNGNLVLTFLNIGRYIKLRRLHRTLTIPYHMTIDPYVEGRHNALEAQEGLPKGFVCCGVTATRPTIRKGKGTAILPCRVTLHVGRPIQFRLSHHVGRIYLERIARRNINRCTITVHFPIGRHSEYCPLRIIVIRTIKVFYAFIRRLRPTKSPLAIQRQSPVALMFTKRNEIRPCWLTIDLQHMVVFPIVMLFLCVGYTTHKQRYCQ